MTGGNGTVTMYPKLHRREWIFTPPAEDPRDARIAELEAQASKFRLFPQQVMDAIEQYDWDGERWFIEDIRAIIEGKAGYPSRDDSLWFTGAEWQGLLDRAIGGECAQRDARITELEARIAELELALSPEGDMTITVEELDA